MECKKCGREAKMYWRDKEKRNGFSETFYNGMCQKCYRKTTGRTPKTLQELNEERKQIALTNKGVKNERA